MQLFITNLSLGTGDVFVYEERVVHQLIRVLRVKIGYIFQVQQTIDDFVHRFTLEITEIKKDKIVCKILSQENRPVKNQKFGMIICMPNARDKLELIIQKLTEIGIPNIVLWHSTRSVLKDISDSKMQRINKIVLEATEQSFSWSSAIISVIQDISSFIEDKKIIIFDFDGKKDLSISNLDNVYGLVGPEGGFDAKDLDLFSDKVFAKINLGNNVLRMETGAIVGSRLIKNSI